MPRRPEFSSFVRDPRFDRYRGRVALLRRGSSIAGHVLVQTEPYSEWVRGHLWWRRWRQAREALWLWVTVDGAFTDHWLTESDAIAAELEDWDRGAFNLGGETFAAEWLTSEESEDARASVFGV